MTAAALLVNEDFAPSVQVIPASISELHTTTGRVFSEWFTPSMSSGDMTGVGGASLVVSGSPRYARTWIGWDGTDYSSGYRAVEFTGGADRFAPADTTLWDLTQSMTFVLCVRCRRAPTVARSIFAKKASYATGSAGYVLYVTTAGALVLEVSNGTTQTPIATATIADELDGICNGAPHWIAVSLNNTTGDAQLFALGAAGTVVAMPSGSKSTATGFKFGDCTFLNSLPTLQVLAWGVLVGAEAEAFALADLNELDNWCQPPSSLASYARDSVVTPIVEVDASYGIRTQPCAGSATTALVHTAHVYGQTAARRGLMSDRGYGLASDAMTTRHKYNRCSHSDNLSHASWGKTNTTVTANAGEDPSGFYADNLITATAANGSVWKDWTADLDQVHTVSFKGRRGSAEVADVTGRLIVIRNDTSAEVASVAVTLTDLEQLFTLQVTAPVTGLRTALEIDTNGATAFATEFQFEWGTVTPHQPQRGTILSKGQTEFWIDNADEVALESRGGTVEVTCFGHSNATTIYTGAFIFDTECGAANEDRIFIQRDAQAAVYPRDASVFDAAGVQVSKLTSQANLADPSVLVTYTTKWDSRFALPGETVHATLEQNGTVTRTGAIVRSTPWSVGSEATKVYPGLRHNMAAHLEGGVVSLRIWGHMPVTTSATIRDLLTSTIAALTPARAGRFVAHPMRSNDFRSWAEQNPTSCFRRFSVREVGPVSGPDVTNTDVEWLTTTFEVVTAYPLDFRAGPQMALDRDDLMEIDGKQIEGAVGLVGFAALEAAADCTVMDRPDREREQGQACAFNVLRIPIGYYRSTAT